jgi:phosphate transport system permease protein
MGRAAGETAPILFTGAAFFLPSLPRSAFDQFMALPYLLYIIATQVPKAPPALPYATASVLILLVLATSAVAVLARARFRRRSIV